MVDNAATPITVSDVAAHLSMSLRSLQAGFRQWRATTPNVFLRQARLQLVRDELLRSGAESNATTTALRYGFSHLGRFTGYYQAEFGESPERNATPRPREFECPHARLTKDRSCLPRTIAACAQSL